MDLFLKIDYASFLDKNERMYTNNADNAIMYPIFEMSCGKVSYLPEICYKYNTGTGLNDATISIRIRK